MFSDDLWAHNPLYEYPIVALEGGTYVVPSPLGILQRMSPQGMYFLGRDIVAGDGPHAFQNLASRLGLRYECYIGQQLGLLTHAEVLPEIVYDNDQKSVDYIITTPEVVVLVEAKSTAPTQQTRAGVFPINGDLDRGINLACRQITRTAELIQSGHPKFSHLQGPPLRGLVVTANGTSTFRGICYRMKLNQLRYQQLLFPRIS